MFLPGADIFEVPNGNVQLGNYLLGLSSGIVVLHNMQNDESIEIGMSQIINNAVITFDPFWSRPTKKAYIFKGICFPYADVVFDLIQRDISKMSRLWTPEWVEFGFIDPDMTNLTNRNNGTADLNLGFISLWEKSLRNRPV